MKKAPAALFVIDWKMLLLKHQIGIPVIAISSTDCDVPVVNYPIVVNDTSMSSIALFTNKVADVLK